MADRKLTAAGIEASRKGRTDMVTDHLDAIAALQGGILDAQRNRDMATVLKLRAEVAEHRAQADRTAPLTTTAKRRAGRPYKVRTWR